MYPKDLFTKIEQLLPILHTYIATGRATITADDKLLLKEVYALVYPGVQLDVACGHCCTTALHYLLAFYEREYPKFTASQPAGITTPVPIKKPKKSEKKWRLSNSKWLSVDSHSTVN